jgi:hypothetical protein
VEREENLGLSRSIIQGVSQACEEHGRAIVVEDDLVVSQYFLKYMNEALSRFETEESIGSIHAYALPINGLRDAYCLKTSGCWGWATWQRAWTYFEPDGQKLLRELRERRMLDRFNLYGTFPYERMLRNQIKGRIDSWAIRWYASLLLQDRLTIHAGRSLVSNAGLDGQGTNCGRSDAYDVPLTESPIDLSHLEIKEDEEALAAWAYHYQSNTSSILRRAGDKMQRVLRKTFGD